MDADRYGTDARLARLEKETEQLHRLHDSLVRTLDARTQRLADVVQSQQRTIRQLRAQLAQLDDRERWVDTFRADQRDPFAELGARPRQTAHDD